MTSKIAVDKPGSFLLLNGDEAVARGAVEAGVKVASAYPGTPSTEILEAIAAASKDFGIYAEWSINEIVALEVAAGASMTGERAIVSMKHVGLNVASDAAMTLAYTGVLGGLVIAVCDDPAMFSSQNEQDTRYFAVHSDLPLLDAASPQEALDMTREAFEISEQLQLPVIVRLTTRVAHGKARVKIGEIAESSRQAKFDKNVSRWVMVPSNSIKRHRVLKEHLKQATELANNSSFNVIEDNRKEIGIVGSGVGYYYARSVLDTSQFSWLKLGFVYPFPTDLFKTFASKVKKIIVVEELRPFIESNIKCLHPEILGKTRMGLSEIGEFTPDVVRNAFAGLGLCEKTEPQKGLELPVRPPVLCPGCTHRAFYYALNTAKGKKTDKIVTGDIGCYTLGFMPPISAVQTCLCMGAGISQAAGMAHAGVEDKVFAVIGDSTFFHGGMPGLLNIAYNKSNVCVIVLANNTVAMTGHQPTPGSGRNVLGEQTKVIDIAEVARSLGIEKVDVVDPYDVETARKVITENLSYYGPSVIISKRPCPLLVKRGPVREVLDTCKACGVCVNNFGCPAISFTAERATIDETLCRGCGVCETICPFDAIRRKE
jgi:indolepyruvate ferredoxin oxidoreductase alpha subunit